MLLFLVMHIERLFWGIRGAGNRRSWEENDGFENSSSPVPCSNIRGERESYIFFKEENDAVIFYGDVL